MKRKEILLNLIGIFLIIVGIVAMIYSFYLGAPFLALWFCYIGSVLMGLAVMFRSRFLLLSQLNILLIPAIIWNIDFFYLLFFGGSFLGIADYFFAEPVFAKIISLQHTYNAILALIAFFLLKGEKKSFCKIRNAWKLSFAQIIIIFALSRLFVSREDNINWVYRIGFSKSISIPDFYYIFIWLVGVLLMIFLTQYILTRLPGLKNSP